MELSGLVKEGRGLGKSVGYPTANLDIEKTAFLREGVYAGWAWLHGVKYPCAFAAQVSKRKLQAYLFGYEGKDFVGEPLKVELVQQVGQMEPFTDLEDLKSKVERDIQKVRNVLDI